MEGTDVGNDDAVTLGIPVGDLLGNVDGLDEGSTVGPTE